MRAYLRYEFFKDTLEHCGTFLLDLNEAEIGYHLFEEFDTDCCSFLHEACLAALLEDGYINQEIYETALRLGTAFRALEDTELWDPGAVCREPAWRAVLELADGVRELVRKYESECGG